MNKIHAWLAREGARIARQPRLEDALLGRGAIRYVAHRLRWVTLRVVLRSVLHIVEVVALTRVFSLEYLGPILFLRHASLILSSLWWGALEAQRNGLRAARRRHDQGEFAECSSQWSVVAVAAIGIQELLVVGFLWLAPRGHHGFTIYDAYAIACGIRLALDTWSRTQHSIVFAVARVRRPLTSMVAVDIAEVFGLLIAWLRIGPFAFSVMLVISGAMRATFTLWYTNATRRQLDLPVPARSIWRELKRGGWLKIPFHQAARFAALNTALQIDSLAIMLLAAGIAGRGGVFLSVSLHALSPLLGAGFAWTRVFYFDFVRLGGYRNPLLAKRFGRLLDRVALIYPIILAALVLPVVRALVPGLIAATPMLLGAVVVARSLFALRQMEAYSYADHVVQIRQGVVLLLVTGFATMLFRQTSFTLLGVASGLSLGAILGRRASSKRPEPDPCETLCSEAFVAWLSRIEQPVTLARVSADRRLTTITKLRASLVNSGHATPCLQLNKHDLLLAFVGQCEERALRRSLLSATAGTAQAIVISASYGSGITALPQVRTELQSCFDADDGRKLTLLTHADAPSDIDALALDFMQKFPEGVRLTDRSGNVAALGIAVRDELHRILAEVSAGRSARSRSSDQLAIAIYRPTGEVSQLFLVPRFAARRADFADFRRKIVQASILESFRSALTRA